MNTHNMDTHEHPYSFYSHPYQPINLLLEAANPENCILFHPASRPHGSTPQHKAAEHRPGEWESRGSWGRWEHLGSPTLAVAWIAPKIEVEVLLDLFLLNVFHLNIGCLNSSICILCPSAQLNLLAGFCSNWVDDFQLRFHASSATAAQNDKLTAWVFKKIIRIWLTGSVEWTPILFNTPKVENLFALSKWSPADN